jgi:hypothetical protein
MASTSILFTLTLAISPWVMARLMKHVECIILRWKLAADWLDPRYVINSEAAKALYKTMPGRTTQEPRDLGREWHSDGM